MAKRKVPTDRTVKALKAKPAAKGKRYTADAAGSRWPVFRLSDRRLNF